MMNRLMLLTLIALATLISCSKDKQTILEIDVNYGRADWPKEGLIKGNLYSNGINSPLYSNLKTDETGKIVISNLLTGTYRFEYYVKPYGPDGDYWPIPKDTVFQFRENTTTILKLE